LHLGWNRINLIVIPPEDAYWRLHLQGRQYAEDEAIQESQRKAHVIGFCIATALRASQ
jgi:hypothetical protein